MLEECSPGLLPQLLGCDDCESWGCAGAALAIIVAAVLLLLALLFFLTDYADDRRQAALKQKAAARIARRRPPGEPSPSTEPWVCPTRKSWVAAIRTRCPVDSFNA